jgi:transposase
MKIDNTARDFKDYEESEEKNFKDLKVFRNNNSSIKNISEITTANTNVANKNFKYFIGIDVAKYKLDLYDTVTDSHKTIKNTEEELLNYINNIIKNMNDNGVNINETLIVIDLTGGYEKLTLNTFYNNNFKNIILAEGLKVKNFKKSTKNNGAKTDKLDCIALIEYAKHFQNNINLYKPQNEDRELITQLYNRIEDLKEIIQQEKNRIKQPNLLSIMK